MDLNELAIETLAKLRLRAHVIKIHMECLAVQKVRQTAESSAALDVATA
jgi:hypothetical protein